MLAQAARHRKAICLSINIIASPARAHNFLSRHGVPQHTQALRCFSSQPCRRQRTSGRETPEADQPSISSPSPVAKTKKKSLALPWMTRSEDGTPAAPDPLRAAQHVAMLLSKDRLDDAQTFTRAASKYAQLVVSWNHLIDYALKNQKLREALKLFQEMKKRAQVPNAQTFTILFRGFAQSQHPKTAVSEAVKLYQSMLTRERVQPNIIHLNAVLKVCAAAGDLESLFMIVETANDSMRSPNGQTYTIILNGLRAPLVGSRRQASADEQLRSAEEAATKEALQRAKTIWREVIDRWRAGAIVIDEALVCAMGRLLLLGDRSDRKSIPELIEQTMQISVKPQVEGLSPMRPAGAAMPSGVPISKSVVALSQPQSKKTSLSSSMGFAHPGNNSLSLVLETLADTGETSASLRYWDAFVQGHGVVPDAQNWIALLHAFSRGKNSTSAANALEKLPAEMTQSKHVRAVMKACLRDCLNQHAFANATRALNAMKTKLVLPDLTAMQTYLRVAYACKRQFENKAGQFDQKAKYAHGRQLGAALDNLQEPHAIIRKHIDGLQLDQIADSKEWLQKATILGDLVALSRKMIAAYDRLIFDDMVPEKVSEAIKPLRNQLNRLVVAYFEERLKRDPAFDRKAMEMEDDEQDAGAEDTMPQNMQTPAGNDAKPHGFSERKGKYYSGMHQINFEKPQHGEGESEATNPRRPQSVSWDESEPAPFRRSERGSHRARRPSSREARSPRRGQAGGSRDKAPLRQGQIQSKEEFWAMAE
ncbi:uncharacterized protein B0I36DRAFT_311939 [Microdochium trichocladiopsis]|uniref:Pentatricopeptide repeat protein n=1 Tax=Microdochium trichocladiopsis TaxID=1682393 RepID=A0A9P9BWX2_9PEZI|nr:uncharacterized protein B0I36DRAFT_311939 [Microdochium trichocladiopsis]KAH7041010.1 hypothetical protein B0I36DRAFT_311939 [Microdochium trichocladiopsis]